MLRFAKRTAKNALNNILLKWLSDQEFRHYPPGRFNEKFVEYSFVFCKLGEIYPRKVLDVGTGMTALPYILRSAGCAVTATDNVRDYWPSGMINRHYHILDDDITATRLSDTFDFITCITVLHHIPEPEVALRNMFSLLKPGGHLLLTFPYTERSYVRNVYDLPGSSYGQGNPFITQSYSRRELDRWLADNDACLLDQEYWQFWTGEHWTVGQQVIPPKQVTAADQHQFTCLLLQKNEAA